MSKIILKPNSTIHNLFSDLVQNANRVFFAGLPGVGKSLMLQQLTLMAQEAGRTAHLLQWDTTRPAFETPAVMNQHILTSPFIHHVITDGLQKISLNHYIKQK